LNRSPKKKYQYFDSPDGEDTFKKLWCVLKPTLPAAAFIGMCDVAVWSQPKGYLNTAVRYSAVVLPIIGIASTFVVATNGIASIRQKDDRINWFFGGFIAGSTFGILTRNKMFGFNMGILGGIAATIRKAADQQGWEIIPKDTKLRIGGATVCLRDYSLTAEKPRNWTTGKS